MQPLGQTPIRVKHTVHRALAETMEGLLSSDAVGATELLLCNLILHVVSSVVWTLPRNSALHAQRYVHVASFLKAPCGLYYN